MINDRDTGELKAQLDALRRDVDRIIMLVDGDTGMDIDGLRQRMDRIEELAEQIRDFKNQMRGISIGLKLTGVGSIGTLIAVLVKLFGLP